MALVAGFSNSFNFLTKSIHPFKGQRCNIGLHIFLKDWPHGSKRYESLLGIFD